jgi:hypothetical protein
VKLWWQGFFKDFQRFLTFLVHIGCAAHAGHSAHNLLAHNGREHSKAIGGLLVNLASLCVCIWQCSKKHI